jgi:hypothetical protein
VFHYYPFRLACDKITLKVLLFLECHFSSDQDSFQMETHLCRLFPKTLDSKRNWIRGGEGDSKKIIATKIFKKF